jgi:hypothetical protein
VISAVDWSSIVVTIWAKPGTASPTEEFFLPPVLPQACSHSGVSTVTLPQASQSVLHGSGPARRRGPQPKCPGSGRPRGADR